MKIHYRDDFELKVTIMDAEGRVVGWPDFDFEIKARTRMSARAYTAGQRGGKLRNCRFDDDGNIIVVCDGHGLAPGRLLVEAFAECRSGVFPDGSRMVVAVADEGVELVRETTDLPTRAEIEAVLPVIRGRDMTWEDLTPEQIDELKRPAESAAARCEEAGRIMAEAERLRVSAESLRSENEQLRRDAENRRIETESHRVEAESLRAMAERLRGVEETGRMENEVSRQTAEEMRVESETLRAKVERLRDEAEVLRAEAERLRVIADTARDGSEAVRSEAENGRVKTEVERAEAERLRGESEAKRVEAERVRDESEAQRIEAETARTREFAGFEDVIGSKQGRLSVSEDLRLEGDRLSLSELAKRACFVDQWLRLTKVYRRTCTLTYDKETGLFGMRWQADEEHSSGYFFKDLTYEEAQMMVSTMSNCYLGYDNWGECGRVNLPPVGYQFGSGPVFSHDETHIMEHNALIEVLVLNTNKGGSRTNAPIRLASCPKLRAIIGEVASPGGQSFRFDKGSEGFPELEYFTAIVSGDFDISTSPKLSLYTMQYLVGHARNKGVVTVTVHPVVYGKLVDEGNVDWHKVLTDAVARGISFATVK